MNPPEAEPADALQGMVQLLQMISSNQEALTNRITQLTPVSRPESIPTTATVPPSSYRIPDFKEKLPVLEQRPWTRFAMDFRAHLATKGLEKYIDEEPV